MQFQRIGQLGIALVIKRAVVIKYGPFLPGVGNANACMGIEIVYLVIFQRHNQLGRHAVGRSILKGGVIALVLKIIERSDIDFEQIKIQLYRHID